MTTTLEKLATEIATLNERIDSIANRSTFDRAVVTAVDTVTSTVTIQVASDEPQPLPLSAVQGILPQVGDTVTVVYSGADVLILPPPGTLAAGNRMSSTDFLTGVQGWDINADGNVEFNEGTFRGLLEAAGLIAGFGEVGEGPNLLPNSNFETDVTGWEAVVGSGVVQSNTYAKEGTYSLRITASSYTAEVATPDGLDGIPVVEGAIYTFRGFSLAPIGEGGADISGEIYWYDDVGDEIITTDVLASQSSRITSVWAGFTYTEKAPPGAVYARVLARSVSSYITGYNVYFDDLVFCRSSSVLAAHLRTGDEGPRSYLEAHGLRVLVGQDGEDPDTAALRLRFVGSASGQTRWTELSAPITLRIAADSGPVYLDRDDVDRVYIGDYLGSKSSELDPAGSILFWPGPESTLPSGYKAANGGSYSRTSYPACFTALNKDLGSCTISIASPAVVTDTGGHGLVDGDSIHFTTTGALPTGLSPGVTYFVKYVSSTTFQVSATRNAAGTPGAAINTSGTQSGTHTYYHGPMGVPNLTNFYIPDYRGVSLFGLDNQGGTDRGLLSVANLDGLIFGAETHQLTAAQSGLPDHYHLTPGAIASYVGTAGTSANRNNPFLAGTAYGGSTITGFVSGGAQAASQEHNNLPPGVLCTIAIKMY